MIRFPCLLLVAAAAALLPVMVSAQVGPRPTLSIQATTPRSAVLAWTNTGGSFALEQSPSVGPSSVWGPVPQTPAVSGSRASVTLTAGADTQFFRLRLTAPSLTTVESSSPFEGERGVSVTRETILRFTAPLAPGTILGSDRLRAAFGGRTLLGRPELAGDRRTATLFYLENLPAGAQIEVSFDGNGLVNESGEEIDADGDGQPGGIRRLRFTTSPIAPLPGTAVIGRVFASERNADGSNRPLQGIRISVDGAEETLHATTDSNGFFALNPSPAGRFFVHVDGRTADESQWPSGGYYPFVGKAWEAVAGRTNNLAGGSGEVFLPWIGADALRVVSFTETTTVTFSPDVLAEHPELAGVTVDVPPNALFRDDGARGGKVGIAPVPPDRLPEPLPPGLNLPLVITIQTDGGLNFDVPAPVRFPNLPDPVSGRLLGPGEKTVLWSFNHDTGRWEPQGTATISADGLFAVTDPGVGVRQPGWHGVATGSFGSGPDFGGGGGGPDGGCKDNPATPEDECKDPCDNKAAATWLSAGDLALDALFTAGGGIKDPVVGCAFGGAISASRTARDCLAFSSDQACVDSQKNNVIGTGLGCVPVIGSVLGLGWGAKGLIDASFDWYDCEQNSQGLASVRRLSVVESAGVPHATATASLEATLASIQGWLEKQFVLGEAAADLLGAIYGSPAWFGANGPEDLAPYQGFFQSLNQAVNDNSPGGASITAGERAALQALPKPTGVVAADVEAAIARVEAILAPNLNPILRAELGAAYQGYLNAAEALIAEGWPHALYGVERALVELSELERTGDLDRESTASLQAASPAIRVATRAPSGEPAVQADFHPYPRGPLYYRLLNLDNGFELRGRLPEHGFFEGIVLAPGAFHRVDYLDPQTLRGGTAWFHASAVGEVTRIPAAVLLDVMDSDRDNDGLRDEWESIVGTNPELADSDHDGFPDGAELRTGGNPLDGVATGIGFVGSAELPRGGIESRAQNGVAVVHVYQTGIELFDVANPEQPRRLSGFPFTEFVEGGSGLDFQWPLVLLGGSTRTVLLDISDPAAPVVRWSRDQRAYSATLAFGRAYLSGDQSMIALDVDTGLPIETINYDRPFQEVRALGDLLVGYPRLGGSGLEILRLSEGGDRVERVGGLSGGSWDGFFVEPGRAYMGDSMNGLGYQIVNITDPAQPSVVGPLGTRATFAHGIAKDSGDRLLALTRAGNQFGENQISIYQLSDLAVTTNFLAGILPPGASPSDLYIYRGRVLATMFRTTLDITSPGRWDIYNYRAFDAGWIPPTVTLQAFTLHDNPPVEQSLGWFRLRAVAQDDVAVRNVEMYLDDTLVADLGSHPFETDLRAPEWSPERSAFTLRARAFDTAGNAAWSAPLTVGLTTDSRAPRLLAFTPPDGSSGLTGGVFRVAARFNEPMAAASMGTGFVVTAGTDGPPLPFTVAEQAGNDYELLLNQPLDEASYLVRATVNLTDLSGNPLFNPTNWSFHVRAPVVWLGGDGQWGEPNLWSTARVPGEGDFVRIDATTPGTVTLAPAGFQDLLAHDLSASLPVVFDNSTLVLGSNAVFHAAARFGTAPAQTAANLQGGDSSFRGGLILDGGFTLRDHGFVLDSPNAVSRAGNVQIMLTSYILRRGSHFVVERGSTLEVNQPDLNGFPWSASDAASAFENRGVIHKIGPGSQRVSGRFRNEGALVVGEGVLHVADPGFENHGVIDIRDGATFRSQGGTPGTASRHGRISRVTGTGTNHIAGSSIFEGEYTFGGTTFVEGETKRFLGGVRSEGSWLVTGNPVVIRGLFADFAGPLQLGRPGAPNSANTGRLQFFNSSEGMLRDFRPIQGDIAGSGRLRVLSPVTISNTVSLTSLTGPWTVRFDGAVTLDGQRPGNAYLQAQAGARLEFTGPVSWLGGPAGFTTNCVVLPGGELTVSGDTLTEIVASSADAGLSIQGAYRKTGAGTNRVQRFINSGRVELQGGALQSLLVRREPGYSQNAGSLHLAGGQLDVRLGTETSAEPGEIVIRGGRVTGSGQITGNLTLSGGTLEPGDGPGVIEVAGGVILQSGGVLAIELGGTEPGTSHDQLRSTSADLDGRLEVSLVNGFQPQLGQEFVIATFTQRSSRTFRETAGLDIGGGRRFDLIYENSRVTLRVVASP